MKPIYQRDFEQQPSVLTIELETPADKPGFYRMPPPPPPFFWLTLADARTDGSGATLRAIEEKIQRGVELGSGDYQDYLRLRGREDLYYFGKYVMGFTWLDWNLHAPIAWAWQAPNGWKQPDGTVLSRFRWGTLARGHLKTTLCSQAYGTWRAVRNPNERILLYTHSDDFGASVLGVITNLFDGVGAYGEQFRALYGEVIPSREERKEKNLAWNMHELTLRRDVNTTDPTFKAKGVDSKVTGGHYTVQLIDDLIGEELGRTQIEKILTKFNNLTPMYHSTRLGERRMVGTPWGFRDTISYVEQHKYGTMAFRIPWDDKHEQPVFDKCDRDEALALKKRNSWFFGCQYKVRAKPEEKLGFKEEWFRYYRDKGQYLHLMDREGNDLKKVEKAACNWFIFIDPNTTRPGGQKASLDLNAPGTTQHDYMAWIVLGVTPDNDWVIPRALRWRCNTDQALTKTFELVAIWKPIFVALEDIASQFLWNHLFLQEWRRGKPTFNLVPWPSGGRSKIEERVRGLIPMYAQARVYHREAEQKDVAEGILNLEGELLDYPSAEFDDLSDAESAALSMAYPPGSEHGRRVRDASAAALVKEALSKLDSGSRAEAEWFRKRRAGVVGERALFEGAWAEM